GTLDLAITQRMPPALRRLVNAMHESIREGMVRPFEGTLRDQSGSVRCEREAALSPAQILTMDYLAENVIGRIPATQELRPEAKALVELQGLRELGGMDAAGFCWNDEHEAEA
ncbi:MAG TPA: hypothetical protein IAC36_09715, partial [Candidatus Aphodomonas merdavium]|nr:hypothetical protein [Candidatus Aphodomonas merdavium]